MPINKMPSLVLKHQPALKPFTGLVLAAVLNLSRSLNIVDTAGTLMFQLPAIFTFASSAISKSV